MLPTPFRPPERTSNPHANHSANLPSNPYQLHFQRGAFHPPYPPRREAGSRGASRSEHTARGSAALRWCCASPAAPHPSERDRPMTNRKAKDRPDKRSKFAARPRMHAPVSADGRMPRFAVQRSLSVRNVILDWEYGKQFFATQTA